MADRSGIEWTDATWNPIVGCSVVSPGCTNCYAMSMAARIERMQPVSHYAGTTQPSKAGAVWTGKMALAPEHIITQPLRWRRPRRIFVNSMGDLFHESVPDEWIDRVFAVMALCPQHTFQVLTKRSPRMREYLGRQGAETQVLRTCRDQLARIAAGEAHRVTAMDHKLCEAGLPRYQWPLPNVWLGVSTEDQRRADERLPDLLATPAAIRFVSAEPLLGPIDLTRVGTIGSIREAFPEIVAREERGRPRSGDGSISGFQLEAVGRAGSSIEFFQTPDHMGGFSASSPRRSPRVDLVIAGGESGPDARPMHPDWARSLRDQCAAAGTAFFFKQWGEFSAKMEPGVEVHLPSLPKGDAVAWGDGKACHLRYRRVGKHAAGRLLDGVEHNAMPEARS